MSLEKNFYRQSPEAYLSSYSPESELTPSEEKLADFLMQETESFPIPAFEDFEEVYMPDQLDKDRKKLREVIGDFENYSGERSDMVTRLLLHLVYDLEYLKPKGGNWEIYAGLTHPYDDKLRGSDMVIVLFNPDTGEELPISVDTTTDIEPEKKKDKLKRDFEHGNLRQLKYYKSPIMGEAVGTQEMPHVVVGYPPEEVQRLAKMWAKYGDKAFARLGIEQKLREELVKQLDKQVEGVKILAPANTQSELTAKLERTALVLSDTKEKEAAEETPVAPIKFSQLLSYHEGYGS